MSTVNIVQTIMLIAAALVSAYAVASAERNRRLDVRRRPTERVFDAVLALAEAAVHAQEIQGEGCIVPGGALRLESTLEIVGIAGFEHTQLMVRETASSAHVVAQTKQAVLEVSARLDELGRRPLWKRQPQIDFRTRQA
jgi:hypothetical protein